MLKYFEFKRKIDLGKIDLVFREDGVSFAEFGEHFYRNNLSDMDRECVSSLNYQRVSFRPASTSETIEYIKGMFNRLKKELLDCKTIQMGLLFKTHNGVYIASADKGKLIKNKESLQEMMKDSKEINGIAFSKDHELAFALYDSFKRGEQNFREFNNGGLARILENTSETKAKLLSSIISGVRNRKVIGNRIIVGNFEPAKKNEVLKGYVNFLLLPSFYDPRPIGYMTPALLWDEVNSKNLSMGRAIGVVKVN